MTRQPIAAAELLISTGDLNPDSLAGRVAIVTGGGSGIGYEALIFVPFCVVGLVVSDPGAVIVQIFTYFPFSAPTTALLRNGLGTLGILESVIVIAILFICAAVMLRLAVSLFQYGSIAYTKRVPLKSLLTNKSR